MTLREKTKICLAGVEWAEVINDAILDRLSEVELVELIPENFFFGKHRYFLNRLAMAQTPVLVHSVELSLGSEEPLKQKHLDEVRRVMDQVNTINLSDHLCFTESGGVEVGQLTPLPFSEHAADVVIRKVEQIQSQVRVPFLIENIANRFLVPEPELSEPEFINRVLDRTGCHLLLDIHNLHANATNFHFDPIEWLHQIHLDRVDSVHLAGGHYDDDGVLVDAHDSQVPSQVWSLYRHLCEQVRPEHTIIERTENWFNYQELIDEVGMVQSILRGGGLLELTAI